jgi:hypothetical protein
MPPASQDSDPGSQEFSHVTYSSFEDRPTSEVTIGGRCPLGIKRSWLRPAVAKTRPGRDSPGASATVLVRSWS